MITRTRHSEIYLLCRRRFHLTKSWANGHVHADRNTNDMKRNFSHPYPFVSSLTFVTENIKNPLTSPSYLNPMRTVEVSTELFEVVLQATSFHFSAVTEGPSVGLMQSEQHTPNVSTCTTLLAHTADS